MQFLEQTVGLFDSALIYDIALSARNRIESLQFLTSTFIYRCDIICDGGAALQVDVVQVGPKIWSLVSEKLSSSLWQMHLTSLDRL